jgi:hypothetical protein
MDYFQALGVTLATSAQPHHAFSLALYADHRMSILSKMNSAS